MKAAKTTRRSVQLGLPQDWNELKDITPDVARQMLADYKYIGQRPLMPSHIAFLAAEMKAGRFQPTEFRIMVDREGRGHLTNGQHRLYAVIESGATIRGSLYFRRAESTDQIAMDFSHTDINRFRNAAAWLSAFGTLDKIELTKTQGNSLSAAIPGLMVGFRSVGGGGTEKMCVRSPMLRNQATAFFAPMALEFFGAIHGGEHNVTRGCERAAVLGVGLVTFQYQAEKAYTFWRALADQNGLRKGNPCRTLGMWLMATPANRYPWYSRCVAQAWNAYFEPRSLQLIRVTDPTAPIKIAGTPYDGKGHRNWNQEALNGHQDAAH